MVQARVGWRGDAGSAAGSGGCLFAMAASERTFEPNYAVSVPQSLMGLFDDRRYCIIVVFAIGQMKLEYSDRMLTRADLFIEPTKMLAGRRIRRLSIVWEM